MNLSRQACVDLVVKFGYEEAARRLGISQGLLHRRASEFGALEEIAIARGRVSRAAVIAAADLLECSEATVQLMRRDGRLPKGFTPADIRDYQRRRLALVRGADLATFDRSWRCCEVCGRFFRDGRSRSRQTCSRACRDACRRGLRIVIWKPSSKRAERRAFTAGSCATCGDSFVARRSSRFCSERCARKAAKRRRKALERGAIVIEVVSTERLLKRDRYRCHICGKKVNRHLHKTDPRHPLAASKDHLQPISFGGVESYDNARLAHYGCNASRGNRGEFQFRLPIAA